MDVGTQKQLLFDDRFMEASEGISLCMNPPFQHPEPVLVADHLWERLGVGAYNTVLREADGRLRMWYEAGYNLRAPVLEGARRLCYAESDDGVHWEKPELGLISFLGSKDNNIVAPLDESQSIDGGTVFRDERASPDERYKLWAKFRPSDAQLAAGVDPGGGLWAFHSSDGLRWQEYSGQPNPRMQWCDTQNVVFWDDRVEQYVGYTRVRETQVDEEAAGAGGATYRSMGRITSPDFRSWSKTQIVLEADADDLAIPVPYQREGPRPNIDFYTSCAMKYEDAQDAYFMLPSAFYHWGDETKSYPYHPATNDFPATMDIQLLTSRDGIDWQRAGERKPFLRRGLGGSLFGAMIYANPWPVPMGDELWLYYSGRSYSHDESWILNSGKSDTPWDELTDKKSGIFRATLRRDGFVSADAGYGGGEFTTPLLRFGGARLELNCDGGAGGWLKVEIQDPDYRPLPGYSLADAVAVVGNSTCKPVMWTNGDTVDKLVGQTVRLRFVMRDMKLYAFQFSRPAGV